MLIPEEKVRELKDTIEKLTKGHEKALADSKNWRDELVEATLEIHKLEDEIITLKRLLGEID
jgi:predicted RNA-binding protein with EMAP domain